MGQRQSRRRRPAMVTPRRSDPLRIEEQLCSAQRLCAFTGKRAFLTSTGSDPFDQQKVVRLPRSGFADKLVFRDIDRLQSRGGREPTCDFSAAPSIRAQCRGAACCARAQSSASLRSSASNSPEPPLRASLHLCLRGYGQSQLHSVEMFVMPNNPTSKICRVQAQTAGVSLGLLVQLPRQIHQSNQMTTCRDLRLSGSVVVEGRLLRDGEEVTVHSHKNRQTGPGVRSLSQCFFE